MTSVSIKILRISLGITFVWIGVLILTQPEAWSGYIKPWIVDLLPLPLPQIMMTTAIVDIAIGVALIVGYYIFIASLVAVLHLAIVLLTSGITDFTVRDIGLIGAAAVLFFESLPQVISNKIT